MQGGVVVSEDNREEILKLSAGDRAAAEGIHIANMLKKRGDGMKTGDYGQIDAQSLHNYDVRKASNVLRELEQMPPEEIKAARTAWDRQAAATGGETFDELLKDRFNDGDTTDMRVAALLRGERAEDRAYALREGMRENDQKEIETALTSPDLSSTDPQKRAAALAEKQALAAKATELDASEQRGVAILTGRDTTKVDEHGVDQQLAAHYASYVETDRHSDNAFVEEQLAVTRDHDREKRKAEAADNEIGTTELWSEGKFSTATEYHRADSDKDRVAVLEGIKSNKGLMFDEAEFKAKYGKDMLEAPELAKFQNDALNAKAEGDERPLEEIERELAHDDLNAMELKIDNVREYGVKPERRPDLEHRLQVELYDKQHSDSLDNRETMREQYGGNAGTEELAREQLLVQDDMLRPAADPFGLGPRELKSGVSDAEFREIDQNLAQTLDVQREEKIKLGEHLGHIFATIAKIAALLTAQPELFALIDIASGLATMAIKKSVAGEAYDPADDTKLLAIDAVVDLATVGVARFAQMRKVGAIGGDAVEIGEKTAGELVEHGATQEAKAEIVDKGVQEVAGDAELADSAPRMPGEAADAAKTETALAKVGEPATEVAVTQANLGAPEQIRGEVEGATNVSRGPHYEKFEAELKEAEAREAAHVTEVKNRRYDGSVIVDSKFDVRKFEAADGPLTEITLDVHMRPGEAVNDVEIEIMKDHSKNGIDRFYNFKDGKRLHTLQDGSNLHVRINFVDDPAEADLVVDIECPYDPATGFRVKKTHQYRWLTDDASEEVAAHELSHQIGLLDEYEELGRSPNRALFNDNSLMGDFWDEGEKVASLKARHIDQIGGDIDRAMQSEAAAAKVTKPMSAVAPPEFDEVKAAAETRRMSGAGGPPEIDEVKAAADTQELPVAGHAPEAPKTKGTPEAQLSNTGKNLPQPLAADEQRDLEEVANERNRVLKDSREADLTAVPQATQNVLRRAERAVRDHMTPDDLAAVIKENRGVAIPNPAGGAFQHVAEVDAARQGVINAIDRVKRELAGDLDDDAREALQRWLSRHSKLLDTVESKT